VQRGASNVYFAVTRSAIYLPHGLVEDDPRLLRAAQNLIDKHYDAGKLDAMIHASAELQNLPAEKLRAVVEKLTGLAARAQGAREQTEEQFRFDEYKVLTGPISERSGELVLDEVPIDGYKQLRKYVHQVRLLTKLRETRVLAGFTRSNPPSDVTDFGQVLSLSKSIDWLPATIVRGEGIFIDFKKELLGEWSGDLQGRLEALKTKYLESTFRNNIDLNKFSPTFVFLHTFAHLLIRELTFECGYGTSSLRERIYFSNSPDTRMAGVLIYTASGDSEGSMGGLVRQGQPDRLELCIRAALLRASWCSGDPVCLESKSQGTNSSNLAACHGCALLPETSCEESNRLLDRVCVIGAPKQPGLGFLGSLVESLQR
jgi:hypothetical protein